VTIKLGLNNLAENAIITASSEATGKLKEYTVDGFTTFAWQPISQPSWIQFDLRSSKDIDSFAIYAENMGTIEAQWSDNGLTGWTDFFSPASQIGKLLWREFASISKRYVRVRTFIKSFDASLQDTTLIDVAFNNDESVMYLLGTGSDAVYQYELDTPGEVETAVFTGSFSVATQDAFPQSISFNNDLSVMYILGAATDSVWQYNLSTNGDVTTAIVDGSFSVNSEESTPTSIAFNSNLSVMYIVGVNTESVWQYNLSTNGDVTTAIVDGSFGVYNQESAPKSIAFNNDLSVMYILGSATDSVWQYNLSTNGDVTTAIVDGSFGVYNQESAPAGISFNSNLSVMYIIGFNSDAVWQYNVPEFGDVSTIELHQSIAAIYFGVATDFGVGVRVGYAPLSMSRQSKIIDGVTEGYQSVGRKVIEYGSKGSVVIKNMPAAWVHANWDDISELLQSKWFFYQAYNDLYPDETAFCRVPRMVPTPKYTSTLYMAVTLPLEGITR